MGEEVDKDNEDKEWKELESSLVALLGWLVEGGGGNNYSISILLGLDRERGVFDAEDELELSED